MDGGGGVTGGGGLGCERPALLVIHDLRWAMLAYTPYLLGLAQP